MWLYTGGISLTVRKKIGRVHLYTRLRGGNLHYAPALRLVKACHNGKLFIFFSSLRFQKLIFNTGGRRRFVLFCFVFSEF